MNTLMFVFQKYKTKIEHFSNLKGLFLPWIHFNEDLFIYINLKNTLWAHKEDKNIYNVEKFSWLVCFYPNRRFEIPILN